MARPLIDISIIKISHELVRTSTFIELLFILEGNADVQLKDGLQQKGNDKTDYFVLNIFDVILLNPTEVYTIYPKDVCTIFSIRLKPQLLASAYENTVPVFVCNSSIDHNHDYSFLRNVLSEITIEKLNKGGDNQLMIQSLTYRLLHILKEYHSLNVKDILENDEFKNTSFRIQSIKQYIMQNFRSSISLEDLSRFLFLTPQYLSKLIKKYFNITFYKYLTNIRLESAQYDLVNTNDTMTNIALNNGFPNLAAYNKAFREKYKTTPTRYREQEKSNLADKPVVENNEDEKATHDDGFHILDKIYNKNSFIPNHTFGESSLVIEADINESSALRKCWDLILNVGYATDFNEHGMYEQIARFQKDVNFKYMRVIGLFDEESISESGKYSFVYCDKILDYIISIGVKPFIEISYKHNMITLSMRENLKGYRQSFNSNIIPYFKHFLKHVINRYGAAEVEDWKFELWAEYNNVIVYTPEKIEEFVRDFNDVYNYSKEFLPRISIGGPGFNAPADPESLVQIMKGLNSLRLTPDFLSFYIYPYTILSSSNIKQQTLENTHILQWEKNGINEKIQSFKKTIHSLNPKINTFYVTEWNLDHIQRNPLHDSIFKAPYILYNIINNNDHINALAYSLLSDMSCEYKDSDDLLFGGSGLLTRNGIRKPAYYAYYFLSKLGPRLIKKGENYIITSKSENQFEVIIFNYKHLNKSYRIKSNMNYDISQQAEYLEDLKSLSFLVKIKNVQQGNYILKRYKLNNAYGSVMDEWIRLNSPSHISQGDIDYLERICVPNLSIFTQECSHEIILQGTLDPNEVNLYTIRKEY